MNKKINCRILHASSMEYNEKLITGNNNALTGVRLGSRKEWSHLPAIGIIWKNTDFCSRFTINVTNAMSKYSGRGLC